MKLAWSLRLTNNKGARGRLGGGQKVEQVNEFLPEIDSGGKKITKAPGSLSSREAKRKRLGKKFRDPNIFRS